MSTNKPSAENTSVNGVTGPWVRTGPDGTICLCIFHAWFVCLKTFIVVSDITSYIHDVMIYPTWGSVRAPGEEDASRSAPESQIAMLLGLSIRTFLGTRGRDLQLRCTNEQLYSIIVHRPQFKSTGI